MLSKLSNGLAGTWDSLDPQERIIVIYLGVVLVMAVGMVAGAPARRERKREDMRELADLIAERLR